MNGTKTLPSVEYLRKRLRYEPDTGKLFWLDYEEMPNNWKARWVGKEAFTATTDKGYRRGAIDKIQLFAHRVAYAIYYEEWPSNQIDHINGVKTDNRIANLRVVTNQENGQNVPMRRSNTSGITGVSKKKKLGLWQTYINVGGKRMHLGYFNTLEEAAAVRKAASEKYGFTDRHGLPTNVGEACD